jgi:hypothetical protein
MEINKEGKKRSQGGGAKKAKKAKKGIGKCDATFASQAPMLLSQGPDPR